MSLQLEVRCQHCEHVQKLQRPVTRAETRTIVCESCERSISASIDWSQVIAGTMHRPPVLSVEAR